VLQVPLGHTFYPKFLLSFWTCLTYTGVLFTVFLNAILETALSLPEIFCLLLLANSFLLISNFIGRMYSELISSSIAEGGPYASKTSYVKLLR